MIWNFFKNLLGEAPPPAQPNPPRLQRWGRFSVQGGRKYNEDACFPNDEATDPPGFALVCDGMGGHSAGHVASRLTAEAMAASLAATDATPNAEAVMAALHAAQHQMQRYLDEDDLFASNMGTTMTLCWWDATTCLAAHCGDSRVYHCRDGKVLWHTRDHTYVNELLRTGDITEAEVATHPSRNVLIRSVGASGKGLKKADIEVLDLQPGDVVLLCSDGVHDHFRGQALEILLAECLTIESFLAEVQGLCEAAQGDNATLIYLQF